MEKDRKIKTVAVAAVLVAIIGLSIAFAALSQTLTINGTAKADKSTWQVVWEKIAGENFVTSGTAEVQENYPTLSNNDTNLNLGTITLKKPGDKVTYRVNMANNGDIDAKVTGVTGVSLDNTYVDYSVKYLDNNTDITQANGRLLAAGAKKLVLVEIKFKESVTTEQFKAIPQEGITVDFNQVSITYSQNDGTGVADVTTPAAVNNCTSFETKETYSVGDVIAICNSSTGKSEDFYVISDNGSTVTALAKYKLYVGKTYMIDEGTGDEITQDVDINDKQYGIQSEKASISWEGDYEVRPAYISFITTEANPYWVQNNSLISTYGASYPAFVYDSNSNLYSYIQNYQTYITTTLAKSSATVSIPSLEQLTSLGCTTSTCRNQTVTENNRTWLYSIPHRSDSGPIEMSDYWLGTAYDNNQIYRFSTRGYISASSASAIYIGIRPVITIAKTDL